ncbi:MAG: DUF1559 domain-containing protein, partial [Pirellulaceae bacterium]|nr:DUF1559 domain-containing protein [Pirellulaceae bacterium]
ASLKNLRQIGLAMHTFHNSYGQLPIGESDRANYPIVYKDGKPLLSWRVHLLPFIEEDVLYRQFKLDESWDSPHNIKLLDRRMPPAYVNPNQPDLGNKTTYLAPIGSGSIFGSNKRIGFRNVLDGTANTIMVIQAGGDKAVPWTKPEDLKYDLKNPAGSLGDIGEKVIALFADGSVQTLPVNIKPATWLKLFKINDGEIIDFDELRR